MTSSANNQQAPEPGEFKVLEQKVDNLGELLNGVRDDMKELAKGMRELIRIDGNIQRLNDAVGRIGRESDDHETRLRALESKRGRFVDDVMKSVVSMVIGGVAVFFVMQVVT